MDIDNTTVEKKDRKWMLTWLTCLWYAICFLSRPEASYEKNAVYPDVILPACRVLCLSDGLLGSPVPRVLVAITLNSYSVQGNKSTTVAVSSFPSTSAGATEKCTDFTLQRFWGHSTVC